MKVGSPISLGTVSPHDYEDIEDKKLIDMAEDLMIEVFDSPPFYTIKNRENVIVLIAHLKAAKEILFSGDLSE